MHEQDFSPFEPVDWTMDPIVFPVPPDYPVRMLTSRHGTRIMAKREETTILDDDRLPIWRLTSPDGRLQVGWVARFSDTHPIEDITRALQSGQHLIQLSQSIEAWLLEQGLLGGPWELDESGMALDNQERRLDLPRHLYPAVSALFVASIAYRFGEDWHLLSGPEVFQCILPTTRHGAMERLNILRG